MLNDDPIILKAMIRVDAVMARGIKLPLFFKPVTFCVA